MNFGLVLIGIACGLIIKNLEIKKEIKEKESVKIKRIQFAVENLLYKERIIISKLGREESECTNIINKRTIRKSIDNHADNAKTIEKVIDIIEAYAHEK